MKNLPRSIYISAPMRGYPEENFPLFNDWEERFDKLGFTVYNPVKLSQDVQEKKDTYPDEVSMRRDLFTTDFDVICQKADAVVTLHEEWHLSSGCRAEVAAAIAVGLPVFSARELEHYAKEITLD